MRNAAPGPQIIRVDAARKLREYTVSGEKHAGLARMGNV